jgi:hypothetical protein
VHKITNRTGAIIHFDQGFFARILAQNDRQKNHGPMATIRMAARRRVLCPHLIRLQKAELPLQRQSGYNKRLQRARRLLIAPTLCVGAYPDRSRGLFLDAGASKRVPTQSVGTIKLRGAKTEESMG